MKICTKCQISKPEEKFAIKNARKNKYQSICKACQASYTKEWYKVNKERHKNCVAQINKRNSILAQKLIRESKNVPCKDCGISYPFYVMDFDHLDQTTKRFELAHALTGRFSIKDISTEISKCEVVCSNCHRERTYKRKLVGREGLEPSTKRLSCDAD